jgi:hypothetical protein
MRCVACGTVMHLVQVAGDGTMMVRGYEHHTFECSACRQVERRLIFNRARRSPTCRVVQIDHDTETATYAAKDTKSGLVVMRNRDRARLWDLCNWIGWRVVDGAPPASACSGEAEHAPLNDSNAEVSGGAV